LDADTAADVGAPGTEPASDLDVDVTALGIGSTDSRTADEPPAGSLLALDGTTGAGSVAVAAVCAGPPEHPATTRKSTAARAAQHPRAHGPESRAPKSIRLDIAQV